MSKNKKGEDMNNLLENQIEDTELETFIHEEDLTEERIKRRREWGHTFLRDLDDGIKIATGKTTLPPDRLCVIRSKP